MLTVHKRFWYRISSRTILAVLVAMENSCCSVTLERKPLNMKMLGAMTTETLLRVILFLVWWSITRWKNSTNAWGSKQRWNLQNAKRWRHAVEKMFHRHVWNWAPSRYHDEPQVTGGRGGSKPAAAVSLWGALWIRTCNTVSSTFLSSKSGKKKDH